MYENNRKKNYKYCIVPECKSTTINTPNKIFISIPKGAEKRTHWQKSIKRIKVFTDKSTYFVCENHFNLLFKEPLLSAGVNGIFYKLYRVALRKPCSIFGIYNGNLDNPGIRLFMI